MDNIITQMRRIAIIGAGDLGQQIAHLALKNGYQVAGFFDDYATDSVMNLPVLGKFVDIDRHINRFDSLVLAVGYKHFVERKNLYGKLAEKYQFETIIDASATIDPTAKIGKGCVIYPNVTIDKDVVIEDNVVLNLSCNICHNSIIGAHSYLSPAVNVAGFVHVGHSVFIGIGATIMDNISIADNIIIGAQSLANKDIADMEGGIRGCSSQATLQKQVIVFGATGSIGMYAALELAKKYKVIAVGHRKCDNGFFEQYDIPYISVNIEDKRTFDVLDKYEPFAVVHLAGILPARMKGYAPERYINSIILGTLNVLNYCVEKNVDRIIYGQSIADVSYLYGSELPIDSDAPRRFPLNNDHSVYAICKNAAVDLMEHYFVKYGLKRFILRFPNIYLYQPETHYYLNGEWCWQSYRKLINMAQKGEQLEIWGNPEIKRDIVYVKDCVQIIMKAIDANVFGGIYNVGTGVGTTMREQIEGIIKVFAPNEYSKKPIERYDMPDSPAYIMDISKTVQELGYAPQYDYISYLEDMKLEMRLKRFDKLYT